jgi:cytochrome b subunit of formate dehydrogenase
MAMLYLASVIMVLNIVLSGGMIFMLQLIRALQIVVHLALNRIVIPSVVMMVFSSLVKVAMFDVLGEERICTNCNVDTWLEYDEDLIQ